MPFGICDRGNDEHAVDRVKHELVLTDPTAAGPLVTIHEGEVRHAVGPEPRDHCVEHRYVDVLALAAPLPLQQRRSDALTDGLRSDLVGDDGTHHVRCVRAGPLHHRHARAGLDDGVVDPSTGERAALPEPRDRHVDQPGVLLSQVVLSEAQSVGHTRPEVLNEHICRLGETLHQCRPGRLLQVHNDRPLVAIAGEVERAKLFT